MKRKIIFKATAFLLIFAVLFGFTTRTLAVSSQSDEYQWITGIYDQRESSLDAVYLGSSNCYAFWNPTAAFNNYGITVYPYTCSSQPLIVAEYLIKEARKTQHDALYILNVNTLGDGEVTDKAMHRLLDYMPMSKNKIQLTDYLCRLNSLSFSDRLEYYLPIIKYHERWKDIKVSDFSTKIKDVKGSCIKDKFFENSIGIEDIYIKSQGCADISDELSKSLNSLLDYCDEQKVKVLFVSVPRAESDKNTVEKINTVLKTVSARGYPVLDLLNNPKAVAIDYGSDYYNDNHTNVHGSLKYTDYLSKYLVKNYGFEDKRNDKAFADWSAAYESYKERALQYALDFEFEKESRDYTLQIPEDFEGVFTDGKVKLSWCESKGVTGYVVYKKDSEGRWCALGATEKLCYYDTAATRGETYTYTVVPYRTDDGKRLYGDFVYAGLEVKA